MSARLQESDLLVEQNKRGRATVYSQLEEFPDEEYFNRWFLGEKSKWKIHRSRNKRNKSEAIVSLEQLKAYAIRNAAVPEEDENKTFVCGFASSVISEKIVFCLTWTTVKLRRFQQQSKMIQVDATYKLNWHGFPVLVCGFSDSSQHFCGTFLALSSNENTWCYERFFVAVSSCTYVPELLMGDGDKTISAAAVNIWGSIKRAMCFAHVKMNLTKKLRPKTMDNARQAIYEDVAFLQLASSPNEFDRAAQLLKREWQTRYAGQYRILEVCAYFSKEWIDSPLNGWFEGFSP